MNTQPRLRNSMVTCSKCKGGGELSRGVECPKCEGSGFEEECEECFERGPSKSRIHHDDSCRKLTTAGAVHRKSKKEIADALTALQEALKTDPAFNATNPNWADVGSLAEYRNQLQRLLAFVRGE